MQATVSELGKQPQLHGVAFQTHSSKHWGDGRVQPTLCMFEPLERCFAQWLAAWFKNHQGGQRGSPDDRHTVIDPFTPCTFKCVV